MHLIANGRVLVLEIDKWYASLRHTHSSFLRLMQYPSRIASHDRPGSDVMGDYTPGAHRCPLANGHPAQDHCA